jgi:drug/metabolite transporter (DMT)-like permease
VRARASAVGVALALGAAASYGVTVVIGRDLARAGVDGAAALAIRFGSSAGLLVLLQLARRKPVLPVRGDRVPALLLGGFGYAVESSFFYGALGRGTAAAVTMLFYSYPAMVAVAEVVLGRIAASAQLAVALVLTGVGGAVVVSAGDEVSISGTGVAFALAAAGAFCAYILLGDRHAQRSDAVSKSMFVALGASIALAVRAFVTAADAPGSSRLVEMLAYGAANAGAFSLMFAALSHIGPTRTAVILTFELVAAVALGAVLLGEDIRGAHVVGGCAVLAGALVAALIPHDHAARDVGAVEPAPP